MDKKIMTMGFLAGRSIAGMRRAKEPVAYLYNGVRLPKLPEWDREAYPYAVIRKDILSTKFKLLLFSKYKFDLDSSGVVHFGSLSDAEGDDIVPGIGYALNTTSSEGWTGYWEADRMAVSMESSLQGPIWTNVDLEYNGTMYLEASEPIPVYE